MLALGLNNIFYNRTERRKNTILLQELMSMREDKAELRARIHLLEKERRSQDLRVAAQNAQLQALLQSIHHLQLQIMEVCINQSMVGNLLW